MKDIVMTFLKRIFSDGGQAILGFISGISVLFMPALPIVVTVFVFILADAIFGYRVSRKYG